MNIVIRPEWTFIEAVEAAWAAYQGGRELGVPNRIRVLEQWANVVGRERALAELEATILKHGGVEPTGAALGFSTYALGKLRRSFRGMPGITPHVTSPSTLEELLQRLPTLSAEREISFTVKVMPRLAALLGYAESETYFEVRIGDDRRYRADAVFAPAGVSRPHVLVELKSGAYPRDQASLDRAVEQAELYRAIAGAPLAALLTPFRLEILSAEGRHGYSLEDLRSTDVGQIANLLRRPDAPEEMTPLPLAPAGSELQSLLEDVVGAETNDQKGSTLEELASRAFEAHPFIRCKYRNLRTRSSEIDIVCELTGSDADTHLRDYGRYFLVECKNWKVPAGAKEIRDFLGKLRKTRVRLGVYFSRNGITGEQHGTDALREVHSAYDQDGTCVVIISGQDLAPLQQIQDVIRIVQEKLDALRFDL